MPWLRWLISSLSPQKHTTESVHVGFVVNKVALGQVFLQILPFSHVNIIPPWLSMLIYHLGDEQYAPWWLQFRDIVSSHQQQDMPDSISVDFKAINHLVRFKVLTVVGMKMSYCDAASCNQ
jgi:hypothetical protein